MIREEKKEIKWDSDEEETTEQERTDVYTTTINEEEEVNDEISHYMSTMEEISIEEDINCCFVDQDGLAKEKGTMDEITKEKDEEESPNKVDEKEHTVMKTTASYVRSTEKEEDSEFYDAVEEIKETETKSPAATNKEEDDTFHDAVEEIKKTNTPETDLEQLTADNKAARLPTIRDSAALDAYINSEGVLPEATARCKDCIQRGCMGCLKAQRANPREEAVLDEMRESLSLNPKSDGSYQFSCSYVCNENLHDIFTNEKSNFTYAVSQAYRNYKSILAETGGRDAINEMMQRGEREGHFRFLSEKEAGVVLSRPHYFCSSTVSWKDTEKRKVRHVSNPSAINKLAGRSLNMLQKVPANTANNPLWPLQNFFLYKYAYSEDISSAYRRVKIKENHQPFQLVIFFDFSKDNWHLFP